MQAVRIAMRADAKGSNNPKDIEYIFLSSNDGIEVQYSVKKIYDILTNDHRIKIFVNNTNSYLIPLRATNGMIYIRSTPNTSMTDELIKLPRC